MPVGFYNPPAPDAGWSRTWGFGPSAPEIPSGAFAGVGLPAGMEPRGRLQAAASAGSNPDYPTPFMRTLFEAIAGLMIAYGVIGLLALVLSGGEINILPGPLVDRSTAPLAPGYSSD